jgi:hypothetical protein
LANNNNTTYMGIIGISARKTMPHQKRKTGLIQPAKIR